MVQIKTLELPYEILQTDIAFPISAEYDTNDPALEEALTQGVQHAIRQLASIVRPDARVVSVKLSRITDKQSESHEDLQDGLPIRRYLELTVEYAIE